MSVVFVPVYVDKPYSCTICTIGQCWPNFGNCSILDDNWDSEIPRRHDVALDMVLVDLSYSSYSFT